MGTLEPEQIQVTKRQHTSTEKVLHTTKRSEMNSALGRWKKDRKRPGVRDAPISQNKGGKVKKSVSGEADHAYQ